MAKKKSSKKRKKQVNQKNIYIYSVTFIVSAIILLIFMLNTENNPVGTFFRSIFLGLFGVCSILIPISLIALAIYLLKTKDFQKFKIKTVFAFIIVTLSSTVIHLFEHNMVSIGDAYSFGSSMGNMSASVGGGFFGAVIAVPLSMVITRPGAFIAAIALILLFMSLVTSYSIYGAIGGFIHGVFVGFLDEFKSVDNKKPYEEVSRKAAAASNKTIKKVKEVRANTIPDDESILDTAIEFASTEDEPKKTKQPKKVVKQEEPKEIEPANFENGIDEIFGEMFDESEKQDLEDDFVEEPIAEEPKKQPAPPLSEEEKEAMAEEIENNLDEEPKREYVFPDVELLDYHNEEDIDARKEMYETANKLISVLDNFGVKAKLLQVTQGPTVTRYEIQPNTGIKLSKIVGLAEDIALNLAVTTVLVAPVPGKAAVGIEVPNREVGSVFARELIESDAFNNSKSKLTIALGKDIGGRVVVGDIAKMPHVLIAGSTGSGKSVCINTILTSILYKASPDEVKLILIDPKVVELGVYNGIPHLLIPVVTDPKRAAGALNWAVAEMMHRYDMFANSSVRNLSGYNAYAEANGMDKLPQIVIVIDELADLMMVASKEVEDYVCRLAQLARAAGIHLIIATQRPSVDVITGLIKANIPSRIAFAVSSQVDSRTILDRGGAEKLLGKGDMLYFPTGMRVPLRVQGAFVSDAEIERLLDFLRQNNEDTHYSEDLAEHIDKVSVGDQGVAPDEDDDGDELLPQAISLAAELGQISTAMIQRRLKVGYSRAGRIIDQMEERGIIGGANGSKPRQVFISRSDAMFSE